MSLLSRPPDQALAAHRGSAARADQAPQTYLSRQAFFAATAVLYISLTLLAVLTLNPYFAQTWDVATFIQASRVFIDGGNPLELYSASRTAQTWPYAYPPLHAALTAVALFIGRVLGVLPEYAWARVPALLSDLGVAVLLYHIIRSKSEDETLARAGGLLWLFNPVTFYDTAVQGHFESEWLFFILLAYARYMGGQQGILTACALALAVLSKQVAILFAIPLWVTMALAPSVTLAERVRRIGISLFTFILVTGVCSLPFVLYSDDFLYMNLTYVANVPVQAQSWLVAVLGMTRAAPDALDSDFVLFRYQTIITMLVAIAIAAWGARRGSSLYLTGALIVLLFFLTSKKVMGYYYVALYPFLLVECLINRKWVPLCAGLAGTAFISLSPYYAAWVDHRHWWLYALLGCAFSLFLVWLFLELMRDRARAASSDQLEPNDRYVEQAGPARIAGKQLVNILLVSFGMTTAAVLAAFLQPFVSSTASPIRAPIVQPGMEGNAAVTLIVYGALLAAILIYMQIQSRRSWGHAAPSWTFLLVLVFAPFSFAVYTLTKESTAIFEIVLKVLGV